MKSIINGFRYDTEKSILIGEDFSSCSKLDFSFWESSLYKTPRKGSYFLAGTGGPMSRYCKSAGQNQWTFGSKIEPMDKDSAFSWSQLHLSTDIVEKEFPDMIEEG